MVRYFNLMSYSITGMWGVKIHQNREAIVKATEKMFYTKPHQTIYRYDQGLLNKYLWPYAINDLVINSFI